MKTFKETLGIYKYKKISLAGWILRHIIFLKETWKYAKLDYKRGFLGKYRPTSYLLD